MNTRSGPVSDAKKPRDLFERLDHRLQQVEMIFLGISGVAILTTFVVMIGAVFSRPWTGFLFSLGAEGAKMLLWPMGFLPAAYVWRRYGHARFDLVLRGVSLRNAHALEIANCVVVLLLAAIMTYCAYTSYADVWRAKTRTLTMHLEYWPVYWCATAGCALLVVEVVFAAVRHWRARSGAASDSQAPWDMHAEGI